MMQDMGDHHDSGAGATLSAPPRRPVDADIAAIQRIGAAPTILRVIAEATGLRLALIARVEMGAWTACAVLDLMEFGLEVGGQLEVATTLCSEVRDHHQPIVIEHASAEPEFCNHPTPKLYGFESYIAVPIFRQGGAYFGNLCALDARPARPDSLREPRTLAMLQLFAELVSLQLAADEEAGRAREALLTEREIAELREQFIAVLGHDLRNPLQAMTAGAFFLLGLPQEEKQRRVLRRILASGERIARMVADIMDFARGRLGGGMPIRRTEVDVAALVATVIEEVASGHPDREIRFTADAAGHAWLDDARIGQLVSNLASNAVIHSPHSAPVDVRIVGFTDRVALSVANEGERIHPEVLARLFEPYFRAPDGHPGEGLGLGLYIAAEVARAHGGSIRVESSPAGLTTFIVELPRGEGP